MKLMHVYYDGGLVLTSSMVLEELGLSQFQTIDKDMLYKVIAANASAFCADMDLRRLSGEEVPNCSELKSILSSNKS